MENPMLQAAVHKLVSARLTSSAGLTREGWEKGMHNGKVVWVQEPAGSEFQYAYYPTAGRLEIIPINDQW